MILMPESAVRPIYLGHLIEATAPRRRTLRGVVLPPPRGSRTGRPRLAIDGRTPVVFEPEDWSLRVLAAPPYRYADLPAEHLATRTMLAVELRRAPAPGQAPIATYTVRKGVVDLYAVADTVPLPELSTARAAAWHAARTCARCAATSARPLPAKPGGSRYCRDCHETVALERWAKQAAAMQAACAVWAREVLADPGVVLAAGGHPKDNWNVEHVRAETVAGDLITEARVRDLDDPHAVRHGNPDPEYVARWLARFDDTISREAFRPHAERLVNARTLTWWGRGVPACGFVPRYTAVPETDAIRHRLALWCGQAPLFRTGPWYPEPRIPWSYTCDHPAFARVEQEPAAAGLAQRIGALRAALHLMADGEPPTPGKPVTRAEGE